MAALNEILMFFALTLYLHLKFLLGTDGRWHLLLDNNPRELETCDI